MLETRLSRVAILQSSVLLTVAAFVWLTRIIVTAKKRFFRATKLLSRVGNSFFSATRLIRVERNIQ